MITFGSILHNEEPLMKGLMRNIEKYCNELIIIDQKSTDETVQRIYDNMWKDLSLIVETTNHKQYADPDRTWLLSMPKKNDWIFMIDADERLPRGISFDELVSKGYDGINFPMRSLYFQEGSGYEEWDYDKLRTEGTEVNEGYPDYHIRLLKKGTKWPEEVHQRPHFRKELNALGHDMLHIKTYEKQLEKAQRYAKLYPGTVEFHNNYISYIQQQLGREVRGL